MATKSEPDVDLERAQRVADEIVCKLEGAAPTLTSTDFRNSKMIAKRLAAEFRAVRLERDRDVRERLRQLPKIEAMMGDDTGCDWIPLHLVLEILQELEARK
jgi:hypothetical protein